mgnify:CR=1 FL=1
MSENQNFKNKALDSPEEINFKYLFEIIWKNKIFIFFILIILTILIIFYYNSKHIYFDVPSFKNSFYIVPDDRGGKKVFPTSSPWR